MSHPNAFSQQQVNTLIEAIVASLPGATLKKDADGHPHSAKLNLADLDGEGEVWFRYDQWKHRLSIHGNWPSRRVEGSSSYNIYSPFSLCSSKDRCGYSEITVDASKNPVKIAAEIGRRFMPGYLQLLGKLVGYRRNDEAYLLKSVSLAADISLALGQPQEKPSYKSESSTKYVRYPDGLGYGNIEVNGETVEFHLRSVPADKAKKLAAFLKTL